MTRILNSSIIGLMSFLSIGQLAAQFTGQELLSSRIESRPTLNESGQGVRGWFGRSGSGFGFGK